MQQVEIGGKKRPFSLDFASCRIAEKRHGLAIDWADFGKLSPADMAKYLYVGLLAGDHDLTEDEVLDWMTKATDEQKRSYTAAVMDGIEYLGSLLPDNAGEAKATGSHGSESSLSPTGS